MRVAWSDLSAEARARLRRCHDERTLAEPCFVVSEDKPGRAPKCLALALPLGLALAAIVARNLIVGLHTRDLLVGTALAGLVAVEALGWAAALVAELGLRRRSALKPFCVVTPIEIVRVEYEGAPVAGRALSEASDFVRVNTPDGRAVSYVFNFAAGQLSVEVPAASRAVIDGVLARARELRDQPAARDALRAQLGLLPEQSGAPPSTMSLRRPFGELWMIVLGVNLMALLLAIVAAKMFHG